MDKNNNDEFVELRGTTQRFGLKVYSYRNKKYIDVTPLLVDMGKNYPVADEFRNNGRLIREANSDF